MIELALTVSLPVLVAAYVGGLVEEHRPGWYEVPAGLRLPKVEVACFGAVLGSWLLLAVALG